jgi:uncharacterized Zn finger protein (UPF0148 family)
MTSETCPKCKSHISEFDLICLNCGFTVTPEIREELVKEREQQDALELEKQRLAHEEKLKMHHGHPLLRKMNRFSQHRLHTGWAELIVPAVIIVLIAIVIILMI